MLHIIMNTPNAVSGLSEMQVNANCFRFCSEASLSHTVDVKFLFQDQGRKQN